MGTPIRILHLEDDRNDAELVQALLAEEGLACEIVRAESRADFVVALEQGRWDLFLSDNSLPSFNGMTALALVQERCPHVPFIFLSGTIGEETAIESLKNGATDYVLKQRPARLASAVRRALREAKERAERHRAEHNRVVSELRYRRLFETALDGILILDANSGQVVDANPFLKDLLGYSIEELAGKNLWEVAPFKGMEAGKTLFAELQVQDRIRYEGLPLETKGGHRIEVEFFSNSYMVDEKRLIQCNIRDITERKQLEEQLRQAQKMEAVGQLTGGIAHDFNNLLTIINGYTEMLLQTLPANDPQRENAAQVKEAGDRAVSLTRQLLAFSRRQMLEPKVLDLNAIVTNGEKMLQRTIGEDIQVATVLTAQLGRVKADPGQIEQVIMNLAVNARDAMPQGGKITIETANVELDENYTRQHTVVQSGSYVMLAISDTGCGMDAATQKRIFEPFFTTKGLGKGTGLGLSTVYGIVKQSGGSIWVYSEVGKGTTFKVYLPRVEQKPDTVPPQSVRAALLNGTETILLVEDDAPLRKLTSAIFQKGGYTVLSASGDDEAFRVCATHTGQIHLLVSDVVMPGMSGHELAERMKSAYPAMKVLYVSGYTDDTVVRHGVMDQRMAFLQKPFTMHGLLRKVREVLDS